MNGWAASGTERPVGGAARAVRTVVVGVGNDDRGDDGAGLEVARRVAERVDAAARIGHSPIGDALRVVTCAADPASLMGAWEGARRAILVDASTSGAPVGTVTRLEVGSRPLPGILHRGSTHALGVAEAIELARRLGALPEVIVVYAVEGRAFGYGKGLSAGARAGVEAAVDRIVGEVGETRRR